MCVLPFVRKQTQAQKRERVCLDRACNHSFHWYYWVIYISNYSWLLQAIFMLHLLPTGSGALWDNEIKEVSATHMLTHHSSSLHSSFSLNWESLWSERFLSRQYLSDSGPPVSSELLSFWSSLWCLLGAEWSFTLASSTLLHKVSQPSSNFCGGPLPNANLGMHLSTFLSPAFPSWNYLYGNLSFYC